MDRGFKPTYKQTPTFQDPAPVVRRETEATPDSPAFPERFAPFLSTKGVARGGGGGAGPPPPEIQG